jgi:hypothetical protein
MRVTVTTQGGTFTGRSFNEIVRSKYGSGVRATSRTDGVIDITESNGGRLIAEVTGVHVEPDD